MFYKKIKIDLILTILENYFLKIKYGWKVNSKNMEGSMHGH